MKTKARAPILSNEADIYGEDSKKLKAHGPFVPTFPTDAKGLGHSLSMFWPLKRVATCQEVCESAERASSLAYPT
jgi:hypothetical protein